MDNEGFDADRVNTTIPTICDLNSIETTGVYNYLPLDDNAPIPSGIIWNGIKEIEPGRYEQSQIGFNGSKSPCYLRRRRQWYKDGTKSEWVNIPLPAKIVFEDMPFTIAQEERIRSIIREEIVGFGINTDQYR